MDNTRTVLIFALLLVLTLIWQAWEKDYGRLRPATVDAPASAPASVPALPAESSSAATVPSANATSVPDTPSTAAAASAGQVEVETDALKVVLDLRGGELSRVQLKRYPESVDTPNVPLTLMDNSTALTFVVQGGILSSVAGPTHENTYASAQGRYELGADANELTVPLTWRSADGSLEVTKTYVFRRGAHVFDTRYEIRNNGATPWTGRVYAQLLRRADKPKKSMMPTYTGTAISSPEKRYEKIPFTNLAKTPIDRDITEGWAAIMQHYFVAAIVPPAAEPFHYYSKALDGDRYIIGMYGPDATVAPGETREVTLVNYAGPKDQAVLEKLAPGLDLTVDYGALWFLAKPMFWLMQKLHGWTGNWGIAIILLTLTVKALLFRLAAASYRSMAHMKRVAPRMTALRERYANDRQRLNQAMMELYKTEKINPLGGCLPVLLQIPVFLALYWVLLESVELRQAPFFGWIRDLSTYDPLYVLPLLMGASMFVQQRMNPAPPDPIQAKVMQILPIVFTVFFLFFPAGLVLYWLVNNTLSIAQQWYITRKIESETPPLAP
jgi:YidC/Oxa1 family membrane protein insertase